MFVFAYQTRKSKSKDLKQLSQQNQNGKSLEKSDQQKEPAADSKNQLQSASCETPLEFTEATNNKFEENPENKNVSTSNSIQQPEETNIEDRGAKSTLETSKGNEESRGEAEILKKESTFSQSQVPNNKEHKQIGVDQHSSTDRESGKLLIEDMSSEQLLKAVDRLETVATRLEKLACSTGKSAQSNADDVLPPFVVAYDDLMKGNLAKYVSLSTQIEGNVKCQADLVLEAFQAQRSFLVQVSRSKQPPQNQLIALLNPTSSKIQAVQDIREKNRGDAFFNHLSGISESISALGWVGSNKPFPFIKEMADSALFYTNRVLKDFKEKDQTHVDWTKAWIGTLGDLRDYTKQYHTTGVSWNPQGGDVKMPPTGPAGFTAPPPPPPPPPPMDDDDISNAQVDIDRDALFKELSKGTEITKGLRKVTDDMKTHKNPSLRKGPAPYKTATAPQPFKPVGGTKNVVAPKTPVLELQDKKWVVEHHHGNHNISITETNIKHTVYIYNCRECTIQVTGKINSIVVDGCKKTGVVFDDVISAVEFINCERVQTQVTGKVPTVSIEKTDGCMVYLSSTSLETEIVTAKCSEINVLMPQENGDYVEYYIPEQFKSTWNGKSMVTVCSDNK